ncbi:hypothetical protein MYP_5017 [Sporocytophaga myxococcoides]|uniref:Uncharacterized protein n=1 Tax=Sporocytophaga myxococcoides TaxID=153721 RepID=A0A098LLD4_9BACT|nr:hypothetical protein [Sporocytophaga myxococcoides]GAL87786.1 hypothetical protein MYP_5017 [Sporocytophaga myxococcoides]
MLVKIYKAIISTSFLWVIGLLLVLWGYYADGIIRILIGFLFIYLAIKSAISDYKLDTEIEGWLIKNQGRIIFFYPTKLPIQNKIKEEILPLFPDNILQAYYDGPKIVGDLEPIRFLIKRIMFLNPKIRPNYPTIIRIENKDLIVKEELVELMGIHKKRIDLNEIKRRIENACG